MIITSNNNGNGNNGNNNATSPIPNQQMASNVDETISTSSIPMRHNAQTRPNNVAQLRRSDSSKTHQTINSVGDQMNKPLNHSSSLGKQQQQQKPQYTNRSNVSRQANVISSVSSPSLLSHSNPQTVYPQTTSNYHQIATQPSSMIKTKMASFQFVLSRYLLFIIYLLLLLSLIVNTFLHFLIYGSNMSIGSLFLDVHHRQELITGDYLSLDSSGSNVCWNNGYNSVNMRDHNQWQSNNHPNELHCDRDSFLSLLDEFYHHPSIAKADDSSSSFDTNPLNGDHEQLLNRIKTNFPGRTNKPYPKIFANFNKEHSRGHRNNENELNSDPNDNFDEEQLYYSSSSTSNGSPNRRIIGDNHSWQRQKRIENRLLIIEIVALILLFILVVTQILGLVAVMKKQAILLILVTITNSLLFCLLLYMSNPIFLSLLLLTILIAFWFILQLKLGTEKIIQSQQYFKQEIVNEIRDLITTSTQQNITGRSSPCVHVSMEQYETMTQQMLHRYSSPIVYCPHYNESLC